MYTIMYAIYIYIYIIIIIRVARSGLKWSTELLVVRYGSQRNHPKTISARRETTLVRDGNKETNRRTEGRLQSLAYMHSI